MTDCEYSIERISKTQVKKTIKHGIIKFSIWFQKWRYDNPVSKRQYNTLAWATNTEDYFNPLYIDDVIILASQVGLFKEANSIEPEGIIYDKPRSIISYNITDADFREKFEKEMQSEQTTRMEVIEYPNNDEDLEWRKYLKWPKGI
jgi:hypothetical protein